MSLRSNFKLLPKIRVYRFVSPFSVIFPLGWGSGSVLVVVVGGKLMVEGESEAASRGGANKYFT